MFFFFLKRKGFIAWFFFFQAEDGIRDHCVTGVQTCALPIWASVRVGESRLLPACSRTSRISSRATSASLLRCSIRVPPSGPVCAGNYTGEASDYGRIGDALLPDPGPKRDSETRPGGPREVRDARG